MSHNFDSFQSQNSLYNLNIFKALWNFSWPSQAGWEIDNEGTNFFICEMKYRSWTRLPPRPLKRLLVAFTILRFYFKSKKMDKVSSRLKPSEPVSVNRSENLFSVSQVKVVCTCSFVADSCHPMDCSLPGSSVHGISQQEHWSGLLFPIPRDLRPGFEPAFPASASRFFTTEPPGNPIG